MLKEPLAIRGKPMHSDSRAVLCITAGVAVIASLCHHARGNGRDEEVDRSLIRCEQILAKAKRKVSFIDSGFSAGVIESTRPDLCLPDGGGQSLSGFFCMSLPDHSPAGIQYEWRPSSNERYVAAIGRWKPQGLPSRWRTIHADRGMPPPVDWDDRVWGHDRGGWYAFLVQRTSRPSSKQFRQIFRDALDECAEPAQKLDSSVGKEGQADERR